MSRWESEGQGVSSAWLVAHIAAGVFIGVLAAAFVIWRFALWQVQQGLSEASAALERSTVQIRHAHEMQRQNELARREDAASTQRAVDESKRAAQAEAVEREAAWNKFYRKPKSCDEALGGSWTVDCANEYIRSKKRFTELYDAGKL